MTESAGFDSGTSVIQRPDVDNLPISKNDKRAASIILPSFRLSQGNPNGGTMGDVSLAESNFQNTIFKYLHVAYPTLEINNQNVVIDLASKQISSMLFPGGPEKKGRQVHNTLAKLAADKITRFIAPVRIGDKRYPRRTASGIHARISTKDVVFQTEGSVKSFDEVLSSEPKPEEKLERLTAALVDNFVTVDDHYLNEKGGRERENPNSRNFRDDPFSSYTIEYVMRGRTTGVKELDEMCSRLRAHILEQVANPTPEWKGNTGTMLDSVITTYNRHHDPDQQYMLPLPEGTQTEIQDARTERLADNSAEENTN